MAETSLSPLPADATAHEFYIDGEFQNPAEQAKIGAVIDGLKPADEAWFVRGYQQQHANRQEVCPQLERALLCQGLCNRY